jgi:hypothetical protein
MSINDPIYPKFDLKHGYWYALQGTETFYDENRELITFKTEIECIKWIDQYKLERERKTNGVTNGDSKG